MMALFLDIFAIVFPVFLIVFLGYGLKQWGWIDDSFIAQANRIVFHICLPALLFYKIGTAQFYVRFNGTLILGCMGSITLTFLLSYAWASWCGYPPDQRGVFSQGAFRANMAIAGLAIIVNAYGEEGLTRAGILLGFLVPLLNLYSVVVLLLPHWNGMQCRKTWIQQILYNPLILASLLGMGWSLMQIPMPSILIHSLEIMSEATLPLALITMGAGLTLEQLRGNLHRAGLASLIKIVMMPILTAGFLWILGVRGMDFSLGILLVGSPTAAASYIMASQMDGDPRLAGSIVVLSTLLSVLTFFSILWGTRFFSVG